MSTFDRIKAGMSRSLLYVLIPVGFALLAFFFVGIGEDEDLVQVDGGDELQVVTD